MFKSIGVMWNKLFCLHKWESQAINIYEKRHLKTNEVLVCLNCGKISIIKY